MFGRGDVIRNKRSRHTTWQVLAVLFDGKLLAACLARNKYRPDEATRVITRPEHYHKVEVVDGCIHVR